MLEPPVVWCRASCTEGVVRGVQRTKSVVRGTKRRHATSGVPVAPGDIAIECRAELEATLAGDLPDAGPYSAQAAWLAGFRAPHTGTVADDQSWQLLRRLVAGLR